jgi:hypothetical protein
MKEAVSTLSIIKAASSHQGLAAGLYSTRVSAERSDK